LNYRHTYHAGNFADVLKHIVLLTTLQELQLKETPYCYLDTHSGIGCYDLQSITTQKSQEYLNGIAKLTVATEKPPQEIEIYLSLLKPNSYPGSPKIAAAISRPQDRLILCELHVEDYQTLKNNMHYENNCVVHHLDGYLGMKSFLPPKENRGLVLIDPPFENSDEFLCIDEALARALKHWRSGHFLIWYPIKNRGFKPKFAMPHLTIELRLNNVINPEKLHACGLVLINPPWKLADKLRTSILPYLGKTLNASWILR
jgi:23S rRNA (adenine2030-N6)-methyltransferase